MKRNIVQALCTESAQWSDFSNSKVHAGQISLRLPVAASQIFRSPGVVNSVNVISSQNSLHVFHTNYVILEIIVKFNLLLHYIYRKYIPTLKQLHVS